MIRYRAAWVLPIAAPPIRDGWVAVAQGRIAGVGRDRDPAVPECDLGAVAILPGLANAHTHLELSHLRDEVPPSPEFVDWVRGVLATRRRQPGVDSADILDGVRAGIAEAVGSGTALIGDIGNTLVALGPLSRSPLAGVFFYELIRFNTADPAGLVREALEQIDASEPNPRLHVSLAAHAPYSVAPAVFRAIRTALGRREPAPCSVHLSESEAEVSFFRHGGGAWRALLEELGSWDPNWEPPGVSPVEFLAAEGFLHPRLLAVHGVQMTTTDLARLASTGTTLVTCPRSNRLTGAGTPPIEAFYASGVRVAVGTDSLASTPDLNLFAELAAMRAIAPSVPAGRLLESATTHGAGALGFGADYGTLDTGKVARMIAVALPPALDDVEEYLVSGIEPACVSWVGEDAPAGPAAS